MARGPRKGAFAGAAQSAERRHETATSTLTIVSTRGHGTAGKTPFALDEFSHVPLIARHQYSICATLAANAPPSSLKTLRNNIAFLAAYAEWYRTQYGFEPSDAGSVDSHFCYELIIYLEKSGASLRAKSTRFRFVRRFMKAIGVDESVVPLNPFPEEGDVPEERAVLSPRELRAALKQAKFEAEVVRRRVAELARIGDGHDPRRSGGGALGDWDDPACRLWIMRNVFRTEIRTFDEWRFERGLWGELRGLEGRPGALIVTAAGKVTRQSGWKGHLRWFFPWADDIAPFVLLILIRSGINLTSTAAMRAHRQWYQPFPFRLGDISKESHAYIVTYKTRGRTEPLKDSKPIRFTSSMKPWSYPYRVLEFVEDLTSALRREIVRRRNELIGKQQRSEKEERELEKLDTIKDDLFIYKTEQGITSLTWDSRRGDTPESIRQLLIRAGLETKLRPFRDAPILFWYSASDQHLFIVQMLAAHARPGTSTLYVHRKIFLDSVAEQSKRIFEHSIELIRTNTFDASKLRSRLSNQSLSEQEIDSLLDERNMTRWGNRCGAPTDPPPEFAHGTQPGGLCAGQDCIDGCPRARWFRDSVPYVAKQLVVAEQTRDALGLESTDGSSIGERIARCNELLSYWPKDIVRVALEEAKRVVGDSCDIFFAPSQ